MSLQLHRKGWACRGALVYVLVGFWDGDYVSKFPYVWYCVGVKSSFTHARGYAIPIGHMCFRCLMFRLSEPCELFFLTFLASWT